MKMIHSNASEDNHTKKSQISYAVGFAASHEIMHALIEKVKSYFILGDEFYGNIDSDTDGHIENRVNISNAGGNREKITERDKFAIKSETILPHIAFLILSFLSYFKQNKDFNKIYNSDVVRRIILRMVSKLKK